MKTYTFHISGMHCASCVALIESELDSLPGVTRVKANLTKQSAEVMGDFGNFSSEEIASYLSEPVKIHGYTLSIEKQRHAKKWSDFKVAGPIALAFIALFIVLQKLGLINLIQSGDVSYGSVFVIGLIASVSTCMAVVGGLVLSMSASFAKEGDKVKPQVLFHLGRLVSFFVLGGVIGTIGSAFALGATGTFILSLLIGLILLALGINLLDMFPWAKKLIPSLPSRLGKKVHTLKSLNHTLTPLLIGIATFFLPCGFTQSMQLYTLTTGGFIQGATTMLVYALGTLPVLTLLSFSSLGIHGKKYSGVFYKTAGLVVIFFGIFNVLVSLTAAGIIPPIVNL